MNIKLPVDRCVNCTKCTRDCGIISNAKSLLQLINKSSEFTSEYYKPTIALENWLVILDNRPTDKQDRMNLTITLLKMENIIDCWGEYVKYNIMHIDSTEINLHKEAIIDWEKFLKCEI